MTILSTRKERARAHGSFAAPPLQLPPGTGPADSSEEAEPACARAETEGYCLTGQRWMKAKS